MNQIFEYAQKSSTQVLVMALLILVGYIFTKYKKLTKDGISQMTEILFFIVTPCLIVNSFLSVTINKEQIINLLIASGLGIVSHLTGYLFGYAFTKVKPYEKQAVYRFGSHISNAGFMALPLAQAMFGSEGVLYLSAYVVVLNLFAWTSGRALFKSDIKVSKVKIILNPGTIGVTFGILAVLLKQVFMPELVENTISYLAGMNTPLAMIITGYYMVGTSLKDCLKNQFIWTTMIFRQILIPLILALVYKFIFGLSGLILLCTILPVSAPCAVITVLFAARFKSDEKTAAELVSFTTAASIITMPIIILITQLIDF